MATIHGGRYLRILCAESREGEREANSIHLRVCMSLIRASKRRGLARGVCFSGKRGRDVFQQDADVSQVQRVITLSRVPSIQAFYLYV